MGASLSLTLSYHYAYSRKPPSMYPLSRQKKCPCTKLFYTQLEEPEKTITLRKLK